MLKGRINGVLFEFYRVSASGVSLWSYASTEGVKDGRCYFGLAPQLERVLEGAQGSANLEERDNAILQNR